MREILCNAYLDYLNNYLTVERYAECNGLTFLEGNYFINLARDVYYAQHPDA